MKNVYIVGPMSGRKEWNWPEFSLVWTALLELWERNSITPHAREATRDGCLTVQEWLASSGAVGVADDIAGFAQSIEYILDERPTLVAIRGWQTSEGTIAEIAVARRMRLPVYEVVYRAGVPVGVVLLSETNECPSCCEQRRAF